MDMILAGDDHNGKMLSLEEARSQLSIWSVLASPLFMSNDLRTVPRAYRDLLLNKGGCQGIVNNCHRNTHSL
jgi:hypothetical protein